MDPIKRTNLIELGSFEIAIYPEVADLGYGVGLEYQGELYATAERNVPIFYSDGAFSTQEEVVYDLKHQLRTEIQKIELEREAGVTKVQFETKDLYPSKKQRWFHRFTQGSTVVGGLLLLNYVNSHLGAM